MTADLSRINSELEALFRKYESAPDSYVFAPLADAYRKAGMLEEAVEICRKGLRKHPEYPSGHVVEGKCHFDVGELDGAETSFKRVLELDPNNLVALKYLGMIQAGRGRLDKASEYFKHILELDPDNRDIKEMLQDIRDVEQSPGRGGGGAQTGAVPGGAKEAPDDEADFEGGPIHLGDDDELSDELATTTLADIYAAQGYRQKAARIYREVLRNQPDNEQVKEKLKALEGDVERGEPSGDATEARTPAEPPQRRPAPVAETLEDDDEDVTLEATVSEILGDDDDLEAHRPTDQPVRVEAPPRRAREPVSAASKGRKLDEQRSYEQFKRWLENMKQ
jgi:tetratricopeptide (TPR) repeat protein